MYSLLQILVMIIDRMLHLLLEDIRSNCSSDRCPFNRDQLPGSDLSRYQQLRNAVPPMRSVLYHFPSRSATLGRSIQHSGESDLAGTSHEVKTPVSRSPRVL